MLLWFDALEVAEGTWVWQDTGPGGHSPQQLAVLLPAWALAEGQVHRTSHQ